MKRLLIAMQLLIASSAQAASWSDLWLTPDQQGQRLLESGKPEQAANTFQDTRRRAYAQIQAGQYAQAAEQLQKLADAQSQYNRGNALARSNKLEDALAAYDQAIQQTAPESVLGRDARHNRQLVAEQLQKQQSEQSQSSQQGAQGQQDAPSDKERNAANQSAQQGKDQQAKDQQGKDQQGKDQQGKDQQGKDQQGQGASGAPSQRQAEAQKSQSSAGESAAEQAKQAVADAKRDAEATLARQNAKQQQGRKAQPGDQGQQENVAGDPPPSEQSLALEQWLRQIPDDPAGLLRRKFLIEHMQREQESRR